MIIRILVALVILIVVIFIGYWIFTGGISRGVQFAKGIDNPFDLFTSTTTGGAIKLPGQPDSLLPGIDITQNEYYTGGGVGADGGTQSDRDRLNDLQAQYDELYAKVKDPKNFGNPSPYRDQVKFGYGAAKEGSQNAEHLVLQADYRNTAPISLAGWSLQSAVTGIQMQLPPAASMFVSGALNPVQPVTLEAGGTVVVSTGLSPVGTSFRENRCSGYLGDVQTFTPTLERQCPLGSEEMPLNAQNIQLYGDACIDFAKTISRCHFPGPDKAPAVTPACRDFLLNRLTYNGCFNAHRSEPDFLTKSWRIYLSAGAAIWRDTHDVVRLLDAQGRTVDVLTY